MSKEESTIIKGVAILLMLWGHLFGELEIVTHCSNYIYVFGLPIANVLTRACGPVPFFMIVSGYGLSYTRNHKVLTFRSQSKRLLKLYVNYWWILLLFVFYGSFAKPDKYPGPVFELIANIVNWHSSYNSVTWFLFPYMLISLSSIEIFRMMDKIGDKYSLIIAIVLGFGAMYMFHAYGTYILSICHYLSTVGLF